jgi:hypothetical protein
MSADTEAAVAAWRAFTDAIVAWNTADQTDLAEKRRLADAASTYAATRAQRHAAAKPVERPTSGGAVFPQYGRSKGQPVGGASRQDLEFYATGCRRTLADPSKSRFHDKERALLAEIEAELARHG